ncbi:lycopene cyclase domain-containing protein [Natronomonas amylolytica]|uniref:lycopene cyclase domain-containing protein n=1 Tax=Natronomonas amylolytica TaxID=3108498 RepID=UPI00300B7CC3
MRPDITVFGRFTYLVTELLWGTVAAALLRRTDSTREALRVCLVLYPFAYAWDRYTLEAGVFEIPLRTGVEIADVPLEEHLFMFVVPSMVVGTYELLADLFDA